jgi:hypothetical protein
MKTFHFKTPLRICESFLQYLLSWQPSPQQLDALKIYLMNLVSQVQATGLRAALRTHLCNSRHLVGDAFIVLTVVSFFLHQFFSMEPWDHSWYYTNWFYFLRTLRPWMIGLFGTLAVLYYWPSKNKSVYIVFTVLHSLCWLGIIHYTLLVYDFNSFHSYPHWSYWVMAGAVGIGFVLASDHLVYVYEHKIKGNHKRFVGLAEMDTTKVDPELRDRLLRDNANEYRRLYTNY